MSGLDRIQETIEQFAEDYAGMNTAVIAQADMLEKVEHVLDYAERCHGSEAREIAARLDRALSNG